MPDTPAATPKKQAIGEVVEWASGGGFNPNSEVGSRRSSRST
jgi:hypothetical protein